MSDVNNERLTEELWEQVELEYPEVCNARDNSVKTNVEFAAYCVAYLQRKVDEKWNNLPDYADLNGDSEEVNS